MNKVTFFTFVIFILSCSCSPKNASPSFEEDLKLLQKTDGTEVLQLGDAMIAVNGNLQGRVFTCSANGMDGRSLGYFNRDLIQSDSAFYTINQLGGEGRIWFGPEVGKFGVFVHYDSLKQEQIIAPSPELKYRTFKKMDSSDYSVTYGGPMNIVNALGTKFNLDISRKIALKSPDQIESELGIKIHPAIAAVAFSAQTEAKNIDTTAWSKSKGLLSLWDIACIPPSPKSRVIIPTRNNPDSINLYFTHVDSTRIKIVDDCIIYRADAKYMNKIGVSPKYCKDVFGSYAPEHKLLTIVKYTFEDDSVYLNNIWGHTDPYKGDVINIFNGEVNIPEDRNWPFYELETLSASKELKPGESLFHMQSIYHFEGNPEQLDAIAQKVLGVGLDKVLDVMP